VRKVGDRDGFGHRDVLHQWLGRGGKCVLLVGLFLVGGMTRLAFAPAEPPARISARLDAAPSDRLVLPDDFLDRLLGLLFRLLRLLLGLDGGLVQRAFHAHRRRLGLLRRLGFGDRFGLLLAPFLLCILRLPRCQLGLLLRLGFAQRNLLGVEHRPRGSGRGFGLGVALHQHALLAHLDVDGARFPHAVGFLDLRRLPPRQRDLLLRLARAVCLAQVLEQLGLVLLGKRRVLRQRLAHAGRLQLLDQQRRREPQLLGKLIDVDLGHAIRGIRSRLRRTTGRAPP
jgi:hypothetical protein